MMWLTLATVIEHHMVCDLNNRLIYCILETESPRSSCQKIWHLEKAVSGLQIFAFLMCPLPVRALILSMKALSL